MVFTVLFNILVSLVLCLTYITSQCRWALNKCYRDTDFLSVKIFVFETVITVHRWERGFVFHISNKTVDPFTPRPRYGKIQPASRLTCSHRLRCKNFPRNETSEHTLLTSTAVTSLKSQPCRLTPLLEFQLCFDYSRQERSFTCIFISFYPMYSIFLVVSCAERNTTLLPTVILLRNGLQNVKTTQRRQIISQLTQKM